MTKKQKMPLQLLVFDFDGVISNSVHDSFRTALNAYIHLFPGHNLPISDPVDPPEAIFTVEKKHPRLYQSFSHLMPLGNRAEDYYVILRIIECGKTPDIVDQASYDRFKIRLDPAILDKYHTIYYQLRRSYQENPEIWSELLPAFPGVIEAIKCLSGRFRLAIATSKDGPSVHIQLKSYGLDAVFPASRILDKDLSDTKKHHLEKLQKTYQVPFHQIHFIDDKVLHLISVADLGVHCHLALWGFNTTREHALAKEHGFHLLELDDLSRLE
ncbi:HAD family hydrolase [bacterium]|nr:HAD family hydrolase [bacterium]